MKFLRTGETRSELRRLLQRPGQLRAAVAYWGQGAIDNLGIAPVQDLWVVCDVLSGGCNEIEIRRLLKMFGNERVRTSDGLHAKVWLGEASALVGSSNASSNGLGFEGRETATLIEANVIVDDTDALAEIDRWWLEEVWTKARQIDERDLERAAVLRGTRRTTRPIPKFADLFEGLTSDPDAFSERNLFVWVYEYQGYDRWAEEALRRAQVKFEDGSLTCWQDTEILPEGSVVIEFNSAESPPKAMGMYRVLGGQPQLKYGAGSLLLCTKIDNFEGLSLGATDIWQEAAALAAKTGKEEWGAVEFARSFLQQTSGG